MYYSSRVSQIAIWVTYKRNNLMKFFQIIFLIALIGFFAFPLSAKKKKKSHSIKTKVETVDLNFDDIPKLKYTTEQINNLQKSAEYKKAQYSYSGGLYPVKMPTTEKKIAALKAKYAKKGKTPFRICVSISETKESHGKKKKTSYYRSSADVYIIDMENKKLVASKKVSLRKLCAS